MVNVRYATSAKRKCAWMKAGRCAKLIKAGGLKGAHFKGEKTLSFPNVKSKSTLKKLNLL